MECSSVFLIRYPTCKNILNTLTYLLQNRLNVLCRPFRQTPPIRDLQQEFVAFFMSQGVVHSFEVIEIDIDHRQLARWSQGMHSSAQRFRKQVSIRQTR